MPLSNLYLAIWEVLVHMSVKDKWRKEKGVVIYLVKKVNHEKIKTGMQNKITFFSF